MSVSVRRGSRTPPLKVVRASLVINQVADAEALNPSTDLVQAVSSTRLISSNLVRYEVPAPTEFANRESASLPPPRNLFQYNNPVDLYDQLDALLQARSMLIAVV